MRWQLLAWCLVPVLAVTATIDASDDHESPSDGPINVLFIGIDDLNDWIGVLEGHSQAATPNIDRLCQEGVLFAHAYCAAPACNPSRVALMTGQMPSRTGVYHNNQPWREPLAHLTTLPRSFQNQGYVSLGSGKMFHGRFPDPDSWTEYYPSGERQTPNGPTPANRPLNGIPNTAHFDWGPLDAPTSEMADAQVADWICARLNETHETPFFLACGFYRPHLPWYAPQEYFDRFPIDTIELPEFLEDDLDDIPSSGIRMARPSGDHRRVTEHDQWRHAVQGYLASIAFTDDMVGRVWEALQASDHRHNTIVVLWTDHGWHLGEKEHWRKFALWEEATRTPLAIIVPPELSARLPAGTTPGSRCDRPVSLVDLYPTLIELCGLESEHPLDGQSLVPLLSDPTSPWERPAVTTHGRGNHAVRSEHFRYIRYANGEEELYDHRVDPMEYRNLASDESMASVIEAHRRWIPSSEAENLPRVR